MILGHQPSDSSAIAAAFLKGLRNKITTAKADILTLPESRHLNFALTLAKIDLDTRHPDIDCMLVSLARLCGEEIALLLAQRDKTLVSRAAGDVLEDRTIEILSETPIDLDKRIAMALRR